MFNRVEINSINRVKILSITLDEKLRIDTYVKRVIIATTAKCLALARLKGLRLK